MTGRTIIRSEAPSYLDLPGVSGDHFTTPNSAQNQITGNIGLRASFIPLTPAPPSDQTLLSKWTTTANQRAYRIIRRSNGGLRIQWSTNGTDSPFENSGDTIPTVVGTPIHVWVTRDASSGDVDFYSSPNGINWAPLGPTKFSTPSAIFASSSAVDVGSDNNGTTSLFTGKMIYGEAYSGVLDSSPKNLSFQADEAPSSPGTWVASLTGETWSWAGGGSQPIRIGPPAGEHLTVGRGTVLQA